MNRAGSWSASHRIRTGVTRIAAVAAIASAALFVIIGARQPAALEAATRHTPDSLTFASDVAPILYRNCVMCHRPGGIGPFSMLNFDTVTGRLKDIKDVLTEGKMPPWHAVAPVGTFRNERRLPDADKRTILRWIANGAPFGDAARMPSAPNFPDGWQIGTPDAVFTMQEDFHIPARGAVEYMYFEVPTNFAEDKWVQAIEIMPGARDVVHHVLVFARTDQPAPGAAPPNAATQAGAAARPKPVLSFDSTQRQPDVPRKDSLHAPPRRLGNLIATTAPGTNVLSFPEGTALRIPAGAVLTFQMHYTAKGHDRMDRTSIGLRFAKEMPSEQILATHFFNGQFTLPAGAKDILVPAGIGFNEPVRLYGLFPHTHLRGKRWQYTLLKPDGTSEVILDVPKYDFNWQTYYLFATPLEIPAGARIVARAWYDNSTDNADNPDPSATVHWGDQTWEEMQYTGMLYSVNSRRLKPTAK
ncbi:MAG TPA: cytochrome c [Gemmatimonadaceae bacterium]|nr:cytochrome c [Gemmatimonadaceae bacterium]